MFRKCPHPTKSTRCQIAEELGLDPKQVKFWFQNKRTQIKVIYIYLFIYLFIFLFIFIKKILLSDNNHFTSV